MTKTAIYINNCKALAREAGSKPSLFSFAFVVALALAVSAAAFMPCSTAFAIEGPKNSRLVFSYDDPANDDNGPGSYSYPRGPVFKANPYMFDLRKIRIYEAGNFYRFDVEFKGRIVRSWPGYMGHRNGWLFNIAEIYIDTDGKWGSGHKKAALGRNVEFPPESRWEKVVFIGPVANDLMVNEIREKTDDLEFAASLNDFVFPSNISVYDYTLSATVNRSELGEFSDRWGVQVLSTVFDNSSSSTTFYNKRVYKSSSDNEFGGASDLFGSPNVLDIIVPAGTTQKDVLSKYRVHPNYTSAQFAVVPMVYGGGASSASPQGAVLAKASDPLAKNLDEAGKKMELKVESVKDAEFAVTERDFEEFKKSKERGAAESKNAVKETVRAGDAAGKDVAAKKLSAAGEKPGSESYAQEGAETENIANNIDGEYKINKTGSDTKKDGGAEKRSAAKAGSTKTRNIDKYDDFLAKLENKKLKLEKDEDEEAFKDVEKFLTKQSAAVYKKNTGSGEKMKDFDPDVYEMARIEGGPKKKTAAEKTRKPEQRADTRQGATAPAKTENAKTPAPGAAAEGKTEPETLKPLIEEPQQSEPEEDKSIIGRLFRRVKKNRAASAKHAVSDETKVMSEDAMVGIAKSELPDNSSKKSGRQTLAVAVEREAPPAAEDGNCVANMKKIYELSVKYIERNPGAQKISMNMLVSAGLMDKPLKCEDGGRYLIEVKNSKPVITCINVNNSGHGSYTK